VGGALQVAELVQVVETVGLVDTRVTETFDCYAGTSAHTKLSSSFDIRGVNLYARKPAP